MNYGHATYGQDILSVPTRMHAYGLHLIAQNICPRAVRKRVPRDTGRLDIASLAVYITDQPTQLTVS